MARDALAAVLITIGICAISTGAFLVSAAVGFAVLGFLLLILGVAIGFGERDELQPPAVVEEAETVSVPAAGAPQAGPPGPAASVVEPSPDLAVPSTVPLAKYLGRTGGPDPVTAPILPGATR